MSATGWLVGFGVGVAAIAGIAAIDNHKMNANPKWWSILFNYPPGNLNRRMKGLDGPFDTKAEAVAAAQRESKTWYPKVVYGTSYGIESKYRYY